MADICKKYIIPFVILLVFGLLFLNWYLNSQKFICETALIFYQKHVFFNQIDSITEAIKTLWTSIQTDTRNYLPALYLKPFYWIGKTSYKSFIFGIFLFCYIPAFAVMAAYINKKLKNSSLNMTLYILATTPIFWYTTALGYPDIFSIGLFVAGLLITCKYKLSEKIPVKILLLISTIFYLSFLFRRWLIFVVISYLLSVITYELVMQFAKRNELSREEKKSRFLNTLKNTAIIGGFFFGIMAILQPNVFIRFFDENYRNIFDGYKVPLVSNYQYVIAYLNLPFIALMFWGAYFFAKNPQKSDFMIFSLINAIVYVLVFNHIEVICIDHALIYGFWLACFLISAIQNLITSIDNETLKKRITIAIIIFLGFNFYYTFHKKPILTRMLVSNCFFEPFAPQNEDILKEIESEFRTNLKQNPDFRYSIWAFENNSFNPQLLFQNGAEHKYFQAGVFPPLIDTEAIVTCKWGFMDIVVADTIYTTEPLRPYIRKEDNKILYKIHEMLANKEGFGQNFVREETSYELDNEEKVIKYVRVKKVTKEQFEELKQIIIDIYPWAKEYYPDYMDDICK